MSVNLNSVMYGCRKAVLYFLENERGGVIINMASLLNTHALLSLRANIYESPSQLCISSITEIRDFLSHLSALRAPAIAASIRNPG
ncbi:MAG: hypothetical protein LUF32_06650 [Clostridiales bacterium]|nr:hypothetical protein [Clostridiales bacterium]